MATEPCPRCNSTRTIRTLAERARDYWRCFECGKAFDVPNQVETAPRRRASDRLRSVNR